ncbi:hypothetical protein ASF21_14260 [Arthrobacter sp. Leaf234]|nr:hypothetical protein ASF21_14260 [Arthrobacter sp. Leaf234]
MLRVGVQGDPDDAVELCACLLEVGDALGDVVPLLLRQRRCVLDTRSAMIRARPAHDPAALHAHITPAA